MALEKIILFYKFFVVSDPETMRLWQMELGRRFNLSGRLIIADHGLNGTLAGRLKDLKGYLKALKELDQMRDLAVKWSAGRRDDFPRLSVKVRPELVSLRPGSQFDVYDSGPGLSPVAWHQFLASNPDVLVLDARNRYESAIGHFAVKNLVKADIGTFAEVKEVVSGLPKDQPILTYCTGDVRCQYLSAYMRANGFADVRHLDGGIIRYGQTFADDGFWQGACYVFDGRGQISFSEETTVVGSCHFCQKPASTQFNCDDCNDQLVVCDDCQPRRRHCQNRLVLVGRRSATNQPDQ